MSGWKDMRTAPRDGSAMLLAYTVASNDVHGYVPWREINAVIGWWDGAWEICFMYDGAADTEGVSSQLFNTVPETAIRGWMPLPA